jgi:protein-disulfide isomerase
VVAALVAPTIAIPSRTAAIYEGIPVGLTEDGDPYVGDPAAPITLHEYSDLLCPFCKRHFEQTYPVLLDKYVRSGQVRFVFHHFPLVNLHPTAAIAAAATLCVAQQSPAAFWVMHDQLLLQQERWRPLADPRAYLEKLASEVGASSQHYQQCMATDQVHSMVQQKVTAGAALGFNATPSFQIDPAGDQPTAQLVGALPADTFVQWFDALIAIVEFSDFACPACATHALTEDAPTSLPPIIDTKGNHHVYYFNH